MMTFCFNPCLGTLQSEVDLCTSFITLLKAHSCLGISIDYPIILPSSPDQVIVSGSSLKEIVNSIPKNESNISLRRLAFSILTHFPQSSFFTSEPELSEDECTDYKLFGQDAESLFWASKMGWSIISMSICEDIKKDKILLDSDRIGIELNNWYGENRSFIKQIETQLLDECDRRLTQLECLGENKKIVLSEPFKKQFKEAPKGLQNLVLSKFRDAYSAKLLFPSRGDDNLVKYCQGTGNEKTYELRSGALGGLRVYFYSDEDTMIVAALHTKSESLGFEQTADINNASYIIKIISQDKGLTK